MEIEDHLQSKLLFWLIFIHFNYLTRSRIVSTGNLFKESLAVKKIDIKTWPLSILSARIDSVTQSLLVCEFEGLEGIQISKNLNFHADLNKPTWNPYWALVLIKYKLSADRENYFQKNVSLPTSQSNFFLTIFIFLNNS